MNTLLRLYPGDTLALLFANVLVQVTVLILVAWLLARLGSRWNAAWRHSIYLVAIVCALASPAILWVTQATGITLLTLRPPTRAVQRAEPADVPISLMQMPGPNLGETPAAPQLVASGTTLDVTHSGEPLPIESPSAPSFSLADTLRALATVTVVIWLLGVALLLARWCHGLYLIATLRRSARPLDCQPIVGLLREVRHALGTDQLPPMAIWAGLDRPIMVGLIRPLVILPQKVLRTLPQPELADVLVHECAHAVCRHQVIGLLQRLAGTLFWPHPLVHLLNRELARAREEVCDNYVLRRSNAPRYARTLLDLSQLLVGVSAKPAALGLFHCHWKLEDRVADLLDRRRRVMTRVNRWSAAALTATFLLLALLIAGTRVAQAATIERRAVNKLVKDFPEETDLSTPESAMAASCQRWAQKGITAALELSWVQLDTEVAKDVESALKHDPKGPKKDFRQVFLNAEIIDVLTYRDDFAVVTYKENLDGAGPYGGVLFGKINGVWKSLTFGLPLDDSPGDLSSPSVRAIAERVDRKKDDYWRQFVEVRNEVLNGRTPTIDAKGRVASADSTKSEKITEGKSASPAQSPGSLAVSTLSSGEPNAQDAHNEYAGDVYSVKFSPDGKTLASGWGDGTIKLWDVVTHKNVTTFVTPKAGGNPEETILIRSVAFSPDGKTLASGNTGSTTFGMIRLWDVASGKNTATYNGHAESWRAGISGIYSVVFSPDGKTLATGHEDNVIRFWDVASGKITATFTADADDFLYAVAFSPDGKKLASGGRNGTITLWDVANGKNIATLKAVGSGNSVYSLVFSPDGKSLGAGCWMEGGGMLWDVASGENKARFKLDPADSAAAKNCNDMAYSVAFSPDGKTLAVGCDNGIIGLWDVTIGKKIVVLTGHTNLVRSVAFSPDGKTLASASDASTVKLWNLASQATGSSSGDQSSPAASQEQSKTPAESKEGTKASERAVAAALNWLARHQTPEGNWQIDYRHECKGSECPGAGGARSDAAATALALLPFLAAGQTQKSRGPYQQAVAKGIEWLVKQQKPDGDLSGGCEQPMYAQGLATITLCETYGMTRDEQVGAAARLAVGYIERAQNEATGGWRYLPQDPLGDTSVFGWQLTALTSAQRARLDVNAKVFENARKWLRAVAKGEHLGLYSYQPYREVTPTMTAVGMLCSQYLGVGRTDPSVVEGMQYLLQNLPDGTRQRDTYYWYYATLVMHNIGGPAWESWNRNLRRVLIESQIKEGCATGSWDPAKPTGDSWGERGGRLMVTSLSTLGLEVYYRYLPLFQETAGKTNADMREPIDTSKKE